MKVRKYLTIIMLVLLCTVVLKPVKAEAETFEEIPIYVVDDMRDYNQVVGLSWRLDWNLNKEAGITEQNRYAKFTLPQDSYVRIKISTVDEAAFAANDYFRLYGNESMAAPIVDNNISFGSDDDYLQLKAGTYYIQCGCKLYTDAASKHSTRIMIGAVPVDKAIVIQQTVSADKKAVTVTVTQKFAEKLGKAKWAEGKVAGFVYIEYADTNLDETNSFTVNKNGWYTVYLKATGSVTLDQLLYVNVTGIGEGAKKGVTYKSGNLKYKLVKEGTDGTVMVTGLVKQKASVTIPENVVIKGQNYKVVKINTKAFYKKRKLKKVTIKATGITSIGKNAFKGIHKKAVIKVPKSKYAAYKKLLTSKTGFAKKTMKVKK